MSATRAPLRAVLFDLDGTLLDTAPDFATVVNRMLAEAGMDPLPYATIRAAVSHGSRELVRIAFGLEPGAEGFESRRRRLLELYDHHLADATAPFPGITALLAELDRRAIAWGVVTNKPEFLARPLLARMALEPAPAILVCPEHVSRTKPDPEPLLLACRELGCAPVQAVYVGDHRRDIEAGIAAGMRTVSAAWGYLAADESPADWNADFCVESPASLQMLLQRHFF